MLKTVAIYKEKKSDRLVILPSGRDKIGLIQYKDYGIVSYIVDKEKIGEFILWSLRESNERIIEENLDVHFEKKYFNRNSYKKVTLDYDLITLEYFNNEYELFLSDRMGGGYVEFKDDAGKEKIYKFDKLPTALELGTKVMELFGFKEKYDEEKGL